MLPTHTHRNFNENAMEMQSALENPWNVRVHVLKQENLPRLCNAGRFYMIFAFVCTLHMHTHTHTYIPAMHTLYFNPKSSLSLAAISAQNSRQKLWENLSKLYQNNLILSRNYIENICLKIISKLSDAIFARFYQNQRVISAISPVKVK